YYNSLCGGAEGARQVPIGEVTDYWTSSYRLGMRWLSEHAEPDAIVIIGVADHVVGFTHTIWMGNDLKPTGVLPPAEVSEFVQQYSGAVYLMYITREEYYLPYVREADETYTPVFQLDVEGVPIHKILKIKEAGSPVDDGR